jgi:hypothetical protein
MNRSWAELLVILFWTCTPAFAQARTSVPVRWEWFVVSTPDLLGPFRGDAPGFRVPVPRRPLPGTLRLARETRHVGQFEIIVTTEGRAMPEKTLRVSGPEIEARSLDVLRRWRFAPASLDGKPIRVRLRVFVEGG